MPKGSFTRIAEDGLQEGVTEITASLSAVVHRHATGKDEDLGVISRMKVSAAFVYMLAQAMVGASTPYGLIKMYKYHEWGTGTTGEANTDTKCETWKGAVEIANPTYVLPTGTQVAAATSYTTVCQLTAPVGGAVITEHCVHPTSACGSDGSSVDSSGLDRSVFAGISLAYLDSMTFTYTLSIPAET